MDFLHGTLGKYLAETTYAQASEYMRCNYICNYNTLKCNYLCNYNTLNVFYIRQKLLILNRFTITLFAQMSLRLGVQWLY